MNRLEMQQEVSFRLNFTEGSADQDFTTTRLQKLIQQSYNKLVERAKLVGTRRQFLDASADITWAASAQQLELPEALLNKTIVDIYDVTNGEPGYPLVVANDGLSAGDMFWYDRETLQWSTVDGPSSARTLRLYYVATAEELSLDNSTPRLIPPQFHELIVWDAAILGRQIADEGAPESWLYERNEMWLDFAKFVALGKPLSDTPRIRPPLSEDSDWMY